MKKQIKDEYERLVIARYETIAYLLIRENCK